MELDLAFPVYAKIGDEDGPAFQCAVIENGTTRLIFSGDSASAATARAVDWANRNLDTPERKARIAEATAKRLAAREKNRSAKEAADGTQQR
jgi:enoyl-CoA hydratase/carnithine racemase